MKANTEKKRLTNSFPSAVHDEEGWVDASSITGDGNALGRQPLIHVGDEGDGGGDDDHDLLLKSSDSRCDKRLPSRGWTLEDDVPKGGGNGADAKKNVYMIGKEEPETRAAKTPKICPTTECLLLVVAQHGDGIPLVRPKALETEEGQQRRDLRQDT